MIKKKIFLLNIFLILVLSFVFTSLILYRQNTLYTNDNWNATKMNLDKGVMGTFTFYLTRNALSKNHLNLGAWHGSHELIYKESVNPTVVEFEFFMEEPSEFSFIFNKDASGYSGLRINIHEEPIKGMLFTSTDIGEFVDKSEINITNIEYSKWNHFKIEFQKNHFTIYINKEKIVESDQELKGDFLIGFRGAREDVKIDNLIIKQKYSSTIRESFENRKGFLPIFFSVFLVLFFILLFIIEYSEKQALFLFFMITATLLAVISGLYLYEYYHNSETYTENENTIDWKGYEGNIEGEKQILKRIEEYPEKENKRIMFIGSSQTWGAGASVENKTFFRVFEDLINSDSKKYECINTGMSGLISERAFYHYNSSWINLEPDIVVIILGNNDDSQGDFYKNLERFVLLNRKENIETVFILEPNSYNTSEHIVEHHPVMRDVADKYNITLIDMHNYLLEKYDTGYVWWDYVHLTDYGQKVFAEKLYSETKNLIVQQT